MSSRAKKQRRKQRIANQVLEDKSKKAQLIVFDEVSPMKYERAAEIVELLKGTEPFLLEPGESFRYSGKRGGGMSWHNKLPEIFASKDQYKDWTGHDNVADTMLEFQEAMKNHKRYKPSEEEQKRFEQEFEEARQKAKEAGKEGEFLLQFGYMANRQLFDKMAIEANVRTPEENESMRGILDRGTSKMNPHRMDPIDMKIRVVVAGSCGGMSQLRGLLKKALDEHMALDPTAGTSAMVPGKTYHRFELVNPEPMLPNYDWPLASIETAAHRKSELLETRLCGDWKRPCNPDAFVTAESIRETIEYLTRHDKEVSKSRKRNHLTDQALMEERVFKLGFLKKEECLKAAEASIRYSANQIDLEERDDACFDALGVVVTKEIRSILWKIRDETREEIGQAKLAKKVEYEPDKSV